MSEKKLGKISFVSFGFGGYQDAMFGLTLTFQMKSSGVQTFISGGWAIERDPHAQWTEADRAADQAELCRKLIELLKQAKVDDVTELMNKPVEVEFEHRMLKSWRILEEVL